MEEDRPPSPSTKRWVQLLRTRSRPDNNLPGQSSRAIASPSQPSTSSPLQPTPDRGQSGPFRNILTTRRTRSARRSPHPIPMASGSSARDQSSNHPYQDPSLYTILASNTNLVQDAGGAKTDLPDPKNQIEDANRAMLDIKDYSGLSRTSSTSDKLQTVIAGFRNLSGIVRNTMSVTDKVQSIPDVVDTIEPLKRFNSMLNVVAEIHPYARVVLSIFTCASKMILDQQDRDGAVQGLLKRLSEVYKFMNEDGRLSEIPTMQELYGKVARQTLECADFIVHYSETKSAWESLSRDVFRETDALTKKYVDVFDTLMQQFRDGAVRSTIVNVYRFVEDLDFKDMAYAVGARQDKSKRCLPGTRKDILSEIKAWIDSTGGDIECVFWLNGTAGKGKSAIAHTIADWFIERGGPGAFFCFDRTREADRRQEKIFTTIARDLADGDPIIRRALASVVHENNELRHTEDIMEQWRELILGPVNAAAKIVTEPVLIVIDALDENSDVGSREHILRILAGKQDTISPNVRVLITSRPLDDISKYLHDASHVRSVSMDDAVHVESSEHDIRHYISTLLKDVQGFDNTNFSRLAVKSDGLFEWARLACEYISSTDAVNQDPQKRFEAVITGTTNEGTRLLDNMYRSILEDIMPKERRQENLPIFCSVMGQILASLEPLPYTTLNTMRQHFILANDRYRVDETIHSLGSLVTGTTDSRVPVRPLHPSFYEFLTDKSRSDVFFVDVSLAQKDLAFASFKVLRQQLRFNICSLESSYLPNSAIRGLEDRVKGSISVELSYSCRFWGTHVGATPVEPLLVEEVKAFFDDERLLFWLEVVGLLKIVSGAVVTLSRITDWLAGHDEHTDTAGAARDIRHFIRVFAPVILRSTPHLYLSALPHSPMQSWIFKKFAAKFPRTPHVVGGHIPHWPSMEKTICVYPQVTAVAVSPDGRRIVCGSKDGTTHIRDMETGEALGAPLRGHTGRIWSIAISPDGHRIVSGSADTMISVWDAGTGKISYLQGHTGEVFSVAVSPDGKRIVSGSADKSIRLWDMETGKSIALEGHTHYVTSVAVFPCGQRIASGSRDETIMLWDMNISKALDMRFQGHTGSVESIVISPDGNRIVSCSSDRTIQVWDVVTGEALVAPLQGHTDIVYTVTISQDGKFLVSGSGDYTIRVWDAQTGKALGMPLQQSPVSVSCVTVSPDGNRIISCSDAVRVWDVDTIRAQNTDASKNPFTLLPRHTDKILSVAISPDGNRIVSGSRDNTIQVWDMYTGKALIPPLQGHTGPIWSIAISPDGNLIVSGSSDNTIRVWNAMTGLLLGVPLEGHTHIVRSVIISPDGTYIFSGSADCAIRVWDVHSGKALNTPLRGHTFWVESIATSPDGNFIVSGSFDKTIRVWNAMTGGELSAPLRGHAGRVLSVRISPDARHIVSGSSDRTIRKWDVSTGDALGMPLEGHTDEVLSIAISPDGNLIVSGSSDKTIRVWDAISGKALGEPLRGHTDQVRSVAISPDGKHIVSCSDDVTIRAWDLEPFVQPQSPAIHFSPNPNHALCSASSFLQDGYNPISLLPTEEGWIVGPEGRLLFWIPASLYPVVYVPGNTLVIPNDALQVDLSHFAHGESWPKCREQDGMAPLG